MFLINEAILLELRGKIMFQIFVILRRKKGTSRQCFITHWKSIHGPLFKKFPQILKYTQYVLEDKCRDDSDSPIDGISILDFENEIQMLEAWKMVEYEDIRKDELTFLENSGAGVHVSYVSERIEVINKNIQ